ncbi:Putative motility protein [Pelagirhabdus alkalitolerans]|uniref:Motility protein n=1 Tax=Pelagirhabdus alkalitolerans TaxID=1612202 RepID=A0A1G6N9S4_9BACI|nr:YjfB family protein [Pelagirhabdus alkalitolerans]SDC64632.1 Putative motility protein [Pelagirhabdus alkalitolerans]
MDVAKMSIAMSQNYTKEQMSVGLMKQTMEQADDQSDQLIKMMEQSIQPHLGSQIDTRA